jgi:hypothetical protein
MMTDYTIAAITYVLIAGFLVSTLLIGGFLILNLGLMSKREQDRVGGRTPSDVGILKTTLWPDERDDRLTLPAMEDDQEYIDGVKETLHDERHDEKHHGIGDDRSAA